MHSRTFSHLAGARLTVNLVNQDLTKVTLTYLGHVVGQPKSMQLSNSLSQLLKKSSCVSLVLWVIIDVSVKTSHLW